MCHVEESLPHRQVPEGQVEEQISPAEATCRGRNLQINFQASTETCQIWCSQGCETERYPIIPYQIESTICSAPLRLEVICNDHHHDQSAPTKPTTYQYFTTQQNLQAPNSPMLLWQQRLLFGDCKDDYTPSLPGLIGSSGRRKRKAEVCYT